VTPTVLRAALAATLFLCLPRVTAAQGVHTVNGLEVSVSAVERATNVSLMDCPPGANNQRGVIKPGDPMEFATVKADFKVLASFKAGPIPKPVLTDQTGKTYNTAQSFADVGGTPAFSCAFSFRVPTGTKVKTFTIGTAAIDIASKGQ